jgi:hypothetical protein
MFWIIAIPVCFGLVMVIKKYCPGYQDDNVIEEKVEDVIKDKTGCDVDLTPESPEKKL